MNKLYTAHQGNNANLIKAVSDFYIGDDEFEGMLSFTLPEFWSEKVSKSFNKARFINDF